MSNKHRITAADELNPGECMETVVDGRILAVYNVDGQFHALDGICPHAGGPLGKGTLQGRTVTCPWHGWQFDVETGQHCLNAEIEQKRYEVAVVGGDLVVDFD